MKSNKPDISLIRKYLNGELDAKAMYKLERQAQDNPMLMDMIMGMEAEHQETGEGNLSEIDDLISRRVQKSKTFKVFTWKPWVAAASLIFAFMAAFWMFRTPQSSLVEQQRQVNQLAPAEQKPEPVENKVPAPVISPKIPLQHIQIAKSSSKTMEPELAKISAKVIAAPAPFDQVPAKSVVDSAAIARLALLKQSARRDSIIRRAAELNEYASNTSGKQLNEVVVVGYGVTKKKEVMGAISTVKPALKTSAVTALQGKVAGTMITGDQSLQEVVVTKNNIKATGKAQPGIGWKEYKKYLNKNAVLSDSIKGTVVITFIIGGNGLPANLKIVKSLSAEADNKAINLIHSGPGWIAGKDDPAKEIKVKIKFH